MAMLLKRLGAEATANTYTDRFQFFQKIAALPSGGYVVVWMSDQGLGYDIIAQRFSADGAKIGGETVVNVPGSSYSSQTYPNVSALTSGGFVAASATTSSCTIPMSRTGRGCISAPTRFAPTQRSPRL